MLRDDLLAMVDGMVIYEKDFNTLYKLLITADDLLFAKIMEEILIGHLYISDLEDIFVGSSYEDLLNQTLPIQTKLREEMTKLINFRRNVLNEAGYIPEITLGLHQDNPDYNDIYTEIKDEEIDGMIYDLFNDIQRDPELVKASKIRMYDYIMSDSTFSKDDLYLFNKSYILPISFEDQILNRRDVDFMLKNNLSEDDVKKIKSVGAFLRIVDNPDE